MATPSKSTPAGGNGAGNGTPAKATAKAAPAKAPAKATAAKAPAKATAAKKAAAPTAERKGAIARQALSWNADNKRGVGQPLAVYSVPKGYVMRWPHGGHDLLQLRDPANVVGAELTKLGFKEGPPKWIVTCNLHGDLTGAKNATEGDILGKQVNRNSWCTGCRKAAGGSATKKAAPAKKAEPAKAQAPKPGPPAAKQAPRKSA
jgi:hypothetical protein